MRRGPKWGWRGRPKVGQQAKQQTSKRRKANKQKTSKMETKNSVLERRTWPRKCSHATLETLNSLNMQILHFYRIAIPLWIHRVGVYGGVSSWVAWYNSPLWRPVWYTISLFGDPGDYCAVRLCPLSHPLAGAPGHLTRPPLRSPKIIVHQPLCILM